MTRQHHHHQDQQTRVLYELSSLVLNLLRAPVLFYEEPAPARRRSGSEMTRAGFASLMLGVSVALMLCGSVMFLIGFLMMPSVLGLVILFYVAGIVSAISVLGRSFLCYALDPTQSHQIPESLLPLLRPRLDSIPPDS